MVWDVSLPPRKVSLFPWAVGMGVEYGAGDRLLSLEAHLERSLRT
jgi:hypothetical protein